MIFFIYLNTELSINNKIKQNGKDMTTQREKLPRYANATIVGTIIAYSKAYGKNPLVYGFLRLKNHVLNMIAQWFPWNKARVRLQRWRGVKIGEHVHMGAYVFVDSLFPDYLEVGNYVTISGGYTYILTHNQPQEYFSGCFESYVDKVIIHEHAWICVGVTILPGVEIGEGACVAAGSLVNKDVPPLTLYGGVPAKFIKDLAPQLKHNYTHEKFSQIVEKRKQEYSIPIPDIWNWNRIRAKHPCKNAVFLKKTCKVEQRSILQVFLEINFYYLSKYRS